MVYDFPVTVLPFHLFLRERQSTRVKEISYGYSMEMLSVQFAQLNILADMKLQYLCTYVTSCLFVKSSQFSVYEK